MAGHRVRSRPGRIRRRPNSPKSSRRRPANRPLSSSTAFVMWEPTLSRSRPPARPKPTRPSGQQRGSARPAHDRLRLNSSVMSNARLGDETWRRRLVPPDILETGRVEHLPQRVVANPTDVQNAGQTCDKPPDDGAAMASDAASVEGLKRPFEFERKKDTVGRRESSMSRPSPRVAGTREACPNVEGG